MVPYAWFSHWLNRHGGNQRGDVPAASLVLGFDDVTLYDGSMGEWAKDEGLSIETG